ncbi:hypothetical protein ALO95_200009 [Pseudomonas syringae pv. antirrhini]|nr:hypothetical protein ALQ23_200377 [Pseudomonas syringae pv. antirrhini]RMW23497.1 hypothetical protein ALO95_200009 [Pseudomonas syringae pv. antirrhini]
MVYTPILDVQSRIINDFAWLSTLITPSTKVAWGARRPPPSKAQAQSLCRANVERR